MAGKNIYNDKDSMDINELAALNEEISDDLIEQLQQQVSISSNNFSKNTSDKKNLNVKEEMINDGDLFEEQEISDVKESENAQPPVEEQCTPELDQQKDENSQKVKVDSNAIKENFDDNFIKKYKAKLQKQAKAANTTDESEKQNDNATANSENLSTPIEELTQGNISEKEYTEEQKEYAESLDLLDGNVKYSKYVIYIDPQNVDFIEGLTVKERKNLINGILRQQDDISLTKQRFKVIQTVINHIIIAILTISISIPVIYYVINASLEATVNNYRRSQTNFQTLYKEKGKITNTR